MELYLEEIDPVALVEEVRSIVEPLAAANGNQLDILCPTAVGTLYTDRTRLKQSLLNLLSNAGKFTQSVAFGLALIGLEENLEPWLARSMAGQEHCDLGDDPG